MVFASGKPTPTYKLYRIEGNIVIDGILSESEWQTLPVADSFYQSYPFDTSYAKSRTEVRMGFTDRYIFIAARCYDDNPVGFVAQSLRRDFSYPRNDAFAVYIDPLLDKTNGFNFTVSPLAVQREGLIATGGINGVTTSWDNRWYSAVAYEDSAWTVEIAIPFKSIRYKSDNLHWGINFSRNDLKRNENSSWSPVPRNFNISTLNFCGHLLWQSPPPPAGRNISLIPYVKASLAKQTNKPGTPDFDGGGEFKIGLTSSLNLDGTINSDFSETDVDDQVINLDRFSIFFPERRTFFQENSDLFATFGFSKIRPFFSRRIGLDKGMVVPILAGARVSGKLSDKWRIGAMDIQTRGLKDENQYTSPPENFAVAAAQRQIGAASNIGAMWVNKQNTLQNKRNSVAALDYNFASADNKWRGKLFYHQSFTNDTGKQINPFAHASWLSYTTRRWEIMWNHEYVGKDFHAEVGYVQRLNYWRLEPAINFYSYPRSRLINRHGPQLYESVYANTKLAANDHLLRAGYVVDFQNSAQFNVSASRQFIALTSPFDASGTASAAKYQAGQTFEYDFATARFVSNFRKRIFFETSATAGDYYTGQIRSFSGTVAYRLQPYAIFSLRADRTSILLPAPYATGNFLLVGPKMDVSFTRQLFLTSYMQYNSQQNNVNINSRLQYRFRPMSDLFLVYTGNFTGDKMDAKNHYIIGKLSIWLNV